MIKFVTKREGKTERFDSERIRVAITKATNSVNTENAEEVVGNIFPEVIRRLNEKFVRDIPKIDEIEEIIIETTDNLGYGNIAYSYKRYRDRRAEARKVLAIASQRSEKNSTDSALLIESDSKEEIGTWERVKIIKQLEDEAGLSHDLAKDISKIVENIVVDMYLRGVRKLTTTDIRAIVDLVLRQEGLETQRKRQALLGMPSADFDSILFSRSLENSNIASHNPEALNLEIAERLQKQYALENIFSPEVAEAHLGGAIHIHDLGYPARVYCSSHSLEYIKRYGLGKILANLESKSNPPNSASVLNQHVQTFLASLQAHYAGALGFGFLNIFYAPLLNRPVSVIKIRVKGQEFDFEKRDFEKLAEQGVIKDYEIISERLEMREVSEKEMGQVAQNLIFASSQNAFSRGGQTLFIDFNIHAGVPSYLKNTPAVGPKGMYIIVKDGEAKLVDEVPRFFNPDDPKDIRNGDADHSKAGGKIVTYGDLEKTSQKFAKKMLDVWRKGDKYGRPFHFPKCDLHVDKSSFEDPDQRDVLDFAMHVAAENGSVYFMFDRTQGPVLAQCCRLKEKIEDMSMLKHPEKLRFCGFQNVTVNLAQPAYKGKDLKGTLRELDKSMELALEAHQQKAKFVKRLLETNGSPMRNLGIPSDDGNPYIDLKKATYIIGVIGLNEAVQHLTGKQMHESEHAYKTGLEIIAHMYKKIYELKKRTGLKFTLEETPAESTTRRLAKVDFKRFEEARRVIKGSAENPYYTNSIHFAPDADIGLIDRIIGQSKFHEMIESGAIIHAYIGEKRPSEESIKHIVKKTLEETKCSQLVFSPTYTECDICGNVMPGEKELCTNLGCTNSSEKTADKRTLFAVTRVVGYYSRVAHWNGSQKQIFNDRKKAESYYAGESGRDMMWMYNPLLKGKLRIILFGKEDCPNCKILKEQVIKKMKELKIEDKVEFKIDYMESADETALVEAALYDVPFDSFPTIVIAGNGGYWKKTTIYSSNCEEGVCGIMGSRTERIGAEEVELEIKKRLT